MKYLSTGQAAKLISVTPNAIVKWIQSGRIQAIRTAGGHYRISEDQLARIMNEKNSPETESGVNARKQFRHCWEFYAQNGEIQEGCKSCVVYKCKAAKCYEINKIRENIGYQGIFCATSCESCPYFLEEHVRSIKVMLVSDNDMLREAFLKDAKDSRIILRTASCGYECATILDGFRPEFVVLDCDIPEAKCKELCDHLSKDVRIPGVKILVAGADADKRDIPDDDTHSRFLLPFNFNQLEKYLYRTVSSSMDDENGREE